MSTGPSALCGDGDGAAALRSRVMLLYKPCTSAGRSEFSHDRGCKGRKGGGHHPDRRLSLAVGIWIGIRRPSSEDRNKSHNERAFHEHLNPSFPKNLPKSTCDSPFADRESAAAGFFSDSCFGPPQGAI